MAAHTHTIVSHTFLKRAVYACWQNGKRQSAKQQRDSFPWLRHLHASICLSSLSHIYSSLAARTHAAHQFNFIHIKLSKLCHNTDKIRNVHNISTIHRLIGRCKFFARCLWLVLLQCHAHRHDFAWLYMNRILIRSATLMQFHGIRCERIVRFCVNMNGSSINEDGWS